MENAHPEEGQALEEILDTSLGGDDREISREPRPNQELRRSRFAREMAIEEFGFRTYRLGVRP